MAGQEGGNAPAFCFLTSILILLCCSVNCRRLCTLCIECAYGLLRLGLLAGVGLGLGAVFVPSSMSGVAVLLR
jgi:hypothetical protein